MCYKQHLKWWFYTVLAGSLGVLVVEFLVEGTNLLLAMLFGALVGALVGSIFHLPFAIADYEWRKKYGR